MENGWKWNKRGDNCQLLEVELWGSTSPLDQSHCMSSRN